MARVARALSVCGDAAARCLSQRRAAPPRAGRLAGCGLPARNRPGPLCNSAPVCACSLRRLAHVRRLDLAERARALCAPGARTGPAFCARYFGRAHSAAAQPTGAAASPSLLPPHWCAPQDPCRALLVTRTRPARPLGARAQFAPATRPVSPERSDASGARSGPLSMGT